MKRALSLIFVAGCAAPPLSPLQDGSVAFGLLGDTPYSASQVARLDTMIGDINREPLAFVVHVGDIGTRAQACHDGWLAERKAQFAKIRHPFVLVPGDNEWSDCRDPLPRLQAWRSAFCAQGERLAVQVQPGEYCEHLRWRMGDTLFVTLNVPGNNNNARMPAEAASRMKAVIAWIDEAEKLAPPRLVLLTQANPFVPRLGYGSFRERLQELGARMPGRVVLVHGDTHIYRDDEPLPGLRRVEVWGAPWVSWLRGQVAGGGLVIEPAGQY